MMSTNEQEREDNTVAPAGTGPGARLRRAREAKGWEPQQIIQEMRINPRILEAIERDEYERLPEAIFVRGYIRHYARLVGLDPEPLIAAYERLASNGGTPAGPPPVLLPRPLHSGDWRVRAMTWTVVLGLIGLTVYWWLDVAGIGEPMRAPQPLDEVAIPQEATPPAATAPSYPDYAPPAIGALPPAAPVASAAPADGSTTPPSPASSTAPAGTAPAGGAAETAATASLPARPAVGTAPAAPASPSPPQAADPTAAATTEPAAPEAAAMGLATGTLTLRFSENAWATVYDGRGLRLMYRELPEGSVQELKGTPPFRLVLGNAPSIRLELNGQPVDYSAHAARGVARFTLP